MPRPCGKFCLGQGLGVDFTGEPLHMDFSYHASAHESSPSNTADPRHRTADCTADPDLAHSLWQSRHWQKQPASHQEWTKEHQRKGGFRVTKKWGRNCGIIPKPGTLKMHLDMLCNKPGTLNESPQLTGYMMYLLDTKSSSRAAGETCWRNIPHDQEQANGNKREMHVASFLLLQLPPLRIFLGLRSVWIFILLIW